LAEAGVTLVALSYDQPDALAAFAEYAGITFPLLSDPESQVIREFGILNTLVDEDDHPWFGMPFPGTYVTNADGIITHKFFENNLAIRPGVDVLVRAALGDDVSAELTPASAELHDQVHATFDLDREPLAPGTIRELRVHLQVPVGRHIYGEQTSDGLVGTRVDIDNTAGLIVLRTVAPATTPHQLSTGETLQVYEGDVTLRVRFCHNGSTMRSPGADELRIAGRVHYQSCDDQSCGLPQSEPFEFTIPLGRITRTRFGNAKDGEMDSLPFFEAMIERRST